MFSEISKKDYTFDFRVFCLISTQINYDNNFNFKTKN